MEDFLEFCQLHTSPAYVKDPATGKYVRMFRIQLEVFLPVGHPDGDKAFLRPVHVSEHQYGPLLETLKKELEQHFRGSNQQGSFGGGSGGASPGLQ